MRLFDGRRAVLRRAVAACLAITGIAGAVFLAGPADADGTGTTCQDLYFPVTIAGLLPQRLYGRLCMPSGARAIQVLVPGASYDSTYWSSPVDPADLSYTLAMNNAGYATLAIDRIGTGRSSKPLSALLTSVTQGGTVHQVVQDLRAGTETRPFSTILLAGHSVGSAVVIIEAGTYHDVDAVLVTGLTHGIDPTGAVPILASLIPADLDPSFADKGYDIGYLTTAPGVRYRDFQAPGPYVAAVATMDETTKAAFAPGEVLDTVAIGMLSPYSKRITVPVMLVMGQDDPAFCGGLLAPDCATAASLYASEAPYYSARLRTYVVDGYGHALNYSPDAPEYHAAVIEWADGVLGTP